MHKTGAVGDPAAPGIRMGRFYALNKEYASAAVLSAICSFS